MQGDNGGIRSDEEATTNWASEALINSPTCSLIDQSDIYPHSKLTDASRRPPATVKTSTSVLPAFHKGDNQGQKKKSSADSQFPSIVKSFPAPTGLLIPVCTRQAQTQKLGSEVRPEKNERFLLGAAGLGAAGLGAVLPLLQVLQRKHMWRPV